MGITRYFDPKIGEEIRLKSGLTRSYSIRRSESYKNDYRIWKNSQRFEHAVQKLQSTYESNFFQEESPEFSIFRGDTTSCITFYNQTSLQVARYQFLLDLMLERLLSTEKLHLYQSERCRRLIADTGLRIEERYILRNKMPWFKRFLPSRFIDTDVLILEIIVVEEHHSQLSVRHYPSVQRQTFTGIDEIMKEFLEQG